MTKYDILIMWKTKWAKIKRNVRGKFPRKKRFKTCARMHAHSIWPSVAVQLYTVVTWILRIYLPFIHLWFFSNRNCRLCNDGRVRGLIAWIWEFMMAKVVIVCNQCNCIVLKTVKTIRKTRKHETNKRFTYKFTLSISKQMTEKWKQNWIMIIVNSSEILRLLRNVRYPTRYVCVLYLLENFQWMSTSCDIDVPNQNEV